MSNTKKKKYKTFSNYALSETLKLTNMTADSIIENVSEYASKDSREWFAETFAEGFESSSPREMSKVLMKLLAEVM